MLAPAREHRALSWGMALSQTPLPERYRKYHGVSKGDVGFFASSAFFVNCVVGAGFVAVPKAMFDAGLVTGVIVTLVATLACDYTKNSLLESMARAEAVTEFHLTAGIVKARKALAAATQAEGLSGHTGAGEAADPSAAAAAHSPAVVDVVHDETTALVSSLPAGSGPVAAAGVLRPPSPPAGGDGGAGVSAPEDVFGGEAEASQLLGGEALPSSSASAGAGGRLDRTEGDAAWRPRYRITTRRFEITEMCELFIGPNMKRLYLLLVCFYLGGVEWAFASVFAASMSANVPLWFLNNGKTCDSDLEAAACWGNFHLWLGVFAAIVIPLSCVELKEQKIFQVIMAGARVAVIAALCGTALASLGCDGVAFADVPDNIVAAPAFDMAGLRVLVPVVVYACVVHPAVPTLAQSSECRGRRLSDAYSLAYAVIFLLYLSVGAVLAGVFGSGVTSQANLHWEGYVGCVATPASGAIVTAADAGWAAKALRFSVLLFPAIDVASAYPLMAIPLGNNMLSAWAGDQAAKAAGMRRVTMAFRVLAAAPPLIGTFFVADLGSIMSVAGVVGFAIAFFVPIALARASARVCVETFGSVLAGAGPAATPYRSRMHCRHMDWAIVVLFGLAAAFTLVNGVMSIAGDA